jgi:trans-aconitate 2-methyltransferase
MTAWDPTQYLKFAGERMRPALDLLARIPVEAPARVVDLGCGAGNLAPLLTQRWPRAQLLGVDSSPQMLAKARADFPQAEFVEADVATWRPAQPVDVLYSNAALHWLDGHDSLLPSLLATVAPGGWMAVQMPRNFAAPSHLCVIETIEQGSWRARLEPHLRRRPVGSPQDYWRLLAGRAAELEIWEIEYLQALKGENPVAEFVKGSWLKQFLDRLEEPDRSRFEADYRARVRAAYPAEANGSTLFPFRRLFILAQAGRERTGP